MSDNVNCQSNCECECELGAHGIDAVIDAEPEVLLFADCLHTGNSVITKCTQTPMLQVAESHSDGGALALGTSSMKCKLIEAMPVLESRALVGNEMSMSLPDLTLGLQDIGLIDRDVKLVRNSLTDIAVKTHADAFAKQSSDMKMDLNFTECQQLCNGGSDVAVQAKTYSKEESPSLLKLSPSTLSGTSSDSVHSGSESSENSVTVTVGPTNNRLSAVLENIPLLYLPHTKQLIRPSPRAAPTLGSLNASNPGNNMPIEKCHFSETLDHRSLSSIQADLPIIDSDVTATEILSTSSGTTTARPNAPYSTSDHDSHSTAGSNVLSQDSDISFKSDLTVINLDDDKDDHAIPLEEFTQGSNGLMASNTLDSGVVCDFSHIIPDGNNTLERTNTNSSLTRTDASSFSSISSISTGTEFSAASFTEDAVAEANELDKSIVDTDEAGFVDINLNARNSYERNHSKDSSQDSGIDTGRNQAMLQQGVKPKKRGITSFLARSLFSRKTKEAPPNEGGVLGWRLFGKVPPKQTAVKEASVIEQEYKASQQQLQHACSGPIPQADPQGEARVKKSDIEAPSTTALILEQRPQGLPSKDPEEELRHRQEYEAMVAAARKKEQRDIKQRKKQMQHQHRVEDALSAAGKVWNNEILPNWETMHTTKKARDLWWHGIPPSLRGRIWQLAIGNELNLTPELYEICLLRAKDRLKIMREAGSDTDSLSSFTESSASREASVDLIKLDGSRTFPQLCIFQKGGPYHEHLQGLLGAYACYRPDVGYVQGMSFIAAVLLLNLDVNDAFICFANLLNQPCQIAFFRLDECLMKSYFDTYEEFFQENLPHLFAHFIKQNITSDLYIIDWMFTLYAKSLPLDVASHVWDVFCRDGEEFLFRTALEQRDIKQRKKQMQHQHRVEDALSAAGKVWNNEILPNWETMHTTKKARDLWWHGIPPSLRGRIWQLAIGNELNLTPELYEICLLRAKDRLKIMREAGSDTDSLSSFTESSASREASVDLIKLDGSRTFPQLCIFQKGGPYHEHLQGLLGAYACYRPDVGYVQGMSFIAAVLLLNLDVNDAFICFANLLNQPCQIAFFRLDECLMKSYFDTYEEFFQENLPHLFAHFIKQNITSDLYIIDWMFTLYAKSLPLDVASHVWDVFCRDGEEFLFRTALGILRLYEDILLNMDFIHLAQFLTRLPEHMSGADLFHSIDQIRMSIDKKKFGQVLAGNRDLYKNMPTTES